MEAADFEEIGARLQQRIGEITARYELDIVLLQKENDRLKKELEAAKGEVVSEERA